MLLKLICRICNETRKSSSEVSLLMWIFLTERFLCVYNNKCPNESVQINEAIIEPNEGKKGLGHTEYIFFILWLLPNFCELFSPVLLVFFLFSLYYLSRGRVILWGLHTILNTGFQT